MVSEKPVIGAPGRAASNESRPTSPDTGLLALIQISFPGRGELIERAFRNSRSFRTLCKDYRDCVAALDRWKRRSAGEARLRRQEYTELQRELGLEIQSWLEAMEAGSPHTSERSRRCFD